MKKIIYHLLQLIGKITFQAERFYLKKQFMDKWDCFIESEKAEFIIFNLPYYNKKDKSFTLRTKDRYIKIYPIHIGLIRALKKISKSIL